MELTCLTFESALQNLLRHYNEHQQRLNRWIDELSERGSELLSEDVVEIESDTSGQTKQRRIGGLQIAARSLFATAMQLSKEQLQAAVRLARLDIFPQAAASAMPCKPLAPEADSAPAAAATVAEEGAASTDAEKTCDESSAAAAGDATTPVTPVRATSRPKPESLLDILAREAEESLKGLTGEMINQSRREHRRQRAKELKQAQKR